MRGGSPASIGKHGQEPLREGMQRADCGGVELVESSCARGIDGRMPLELFPHPVTELGRSLLGERDRRDRPHRDARADQGDDAVDERRRLAGARARLDEQRVGQVGADLGARRRVGILGCAGEQRQLRALHD